MRNKKDLPYQGEGVEEKKLVKLYNDSESGLSGFDKILNIYTNLERMRIDMEAEIETELKKSIKKCLEQNDADLEKVDKIYQEVFKIFISFPIYTDHDFYEYCKSKFDQIEILTTKFDGAEPGLQFSYAQELASILVFTDYLEFIRIRFDAILIGFFLRYVIKKGYPDQLESNDQMETEKREEKMKKLDKIPNRYKHRAPQMREKEKELLENYPEKNQSEILEDLQDWHLKLTGKEIDESLLRYHLGHKK